MPPKVTIIGDDKRKIQEHRYNKDIYDHIDNIDLGCIVRLNVLSAVHDALKKGWKDRVSQVFKGRSGVNGNLTIPTEMGMVLLREDHEDDTQLMVNLMSIQTPAMLLPIALRKAANRYAISALEKEQNFMPTIVRLTKTSAFHPELMNLPQNLTNAVCNQLKNGAF